MKKLTLILVAVMLIGTLTFAGIGILSAHNNGIKEGKVMGNKGFIPDALVKILGMTWENIRTELEKGKTVVQLASEKGITKAVLIQKIMDLRKTELQKLVTDGKITKEQMDKMLADYKTRLETLLDTSLKAREGKGLGGKGPGGKGFKGNCCKPSP